MDKISNNAFQVGGWLVEPELNRLSNANDSIHLEPRTMDVLVLLCVQAGDVVSVDDIISSVWGGRPMGDNPVYKSIAKLRRALGDTANESKYIATVAKKGYRMVADVNRFSTADSRIAFAHSTRTRLLRYVPVAVGIMFGVVVAAIFFWRPQPEPLELQSISSFRGSHSQPSFSPDGDAIAFINDLDGDANVWVLDLGSASQKALTYSSHKDSRPRWSPDGQSILFQRNDGIWKVPIDGGDPVEVIRDAHNPNWSRDGQRLVFERHYEIWVADADGGRQYRVNGVPRKELSLAPRWPAFSPSGEEIVYLDAGSTPFSDLWQVSASGGVPKQLTFEPRISSAPVWAPDGESIIYSTKRGGSQTLWQVSIEDGLARPLLTGSGDDNFPDISGDGKRLVYSNSRERFAILRTTPATGEERVLHESRQVLVGPELSPTKTRIAFSALTAAGGVQVFTMPLSGGAPRQITFDTVASHALPRWSADGQHIYFYYTRAGAAFSKVSSSGGDIVEVVSGWDWGVTNGASVSPDETRIVYSRLTGMVPIQTLLREISTGNDRTFYAALEYPRWSKDGTNIIGALHEDQSFPGDVSICPTAGTSCQAIANDARIPMWSSDESEVYFVRGYGQSQELYVSSSDGSGEERKLMTMAPLFPLGPFYDVAPNGDIIWIRHEQEPSEIWTTELE